jgi:hypothetical protein
MFAEFDVVQLRELSLECHSFVTSCLGKSDGPVTSSITYIHGISAIGIINGKGLIKWDY